jgi:diadenosine tetraphosphate (Ap4A) HIT family hydrolase
MDGEQEDKKPKRVFQDLSHLSAEERKKLRFEEREKLQQEMEAKRLERLAKEEQEIKHKKELEKNRHDEEAKRMSDSAQAVRMRLAQEEKERKRQAELDAIALEEEVKRKQQESIEAAIKEKEDFYAKLGLSEDGTAIEQDGGALHFLKKSHLEQEEDEATRRFAMEDLEFNLNPGDDVEDVVDEPQITASDVTVDIEDLGLLAGVEDLEALNVPHLESCSFCRVNKKILKANMLYETAHVLVFLDPKPLHQGQLIIAPRGHYSSLRECPEHVANDLIQTAKLASIALGASLLKVEALSFYWSESVDIPASQRHVYMSGIPRRQGDGVSIKFGVKDPFDKSGLTQLAEDLKKFFA